MSKSNLPKAKENCLEIDSISEAASRVLRAYRILPPKQFINLNVTNTRLGRRLLRGVVNTGQFLGTTKIRHEYESTLDIQKKQLNGTNVIDIQPHRIPGEKKDKVLLYIHGGAFAMCSATSTLAFAMMVASTLNTRVLSVDYTLAPDKKLPQILLEIERVLDSILQEQCKAPSDIALLGDSAGGFLAISIANSLAKTNQKLWGLVLCSPWTDLTLSGESIQTNAQEDVMLKVENFIEVAVENVIPEGTTAAQNTILFDDVDARFPNTLIIRAGLDIISDDATRYHRKLDQAKAKSTMISYNRLWHDFPVTNPNLDESKEVVHAIKEHLFPAEMQ